MKNKFTAFARALRLYKYVMFGFSGSRNFYCPTNNIRVTRLQRMRQDGHVAFICSITLKR